MKPGLQPGQTAEVEVTVSEEMLASFEGEKVHELYSTSMLVNHMEWVARKLILPYLESGEAGMGSYAEVSHLRLTLPGMKVRLRATVTDIRDNKVICLVEAFNPRGKIARGVITQAVVDRSWLDRKMNEMSAAENPTQEVGPSVKSL